MLRRDEICSVHAGNPDALRGGFVSAREGISQASDERPSYEGRAADLFAQAVCWCKLDLRLNSGLIQENQRIPASELVLELDQAAIARREYVFSYILTELDLAPRSPSSSSS